MRAFDTRPAKEVYLRAIIHTLFDRGVLTRQSSIVDIGAWIGDNSLVWALHLSTPASVIAIDPSEGNLDFIRKVADVNHIGNVRTVNAVCSGSSGQTLYFDDSVDHASFSTTAGGRKSLQSVSLDDIWVSLGSPPVQLVHLDVEGFEYHVTSGANLLITSHHPLVIFEQHLRDESGLIAICDLFRDHGYKIFMINEVLPGCDLDCRNFVAATTQQAAELEALDLDSSCSSVGGFKAMPGSVLIPIG